LELFDKIYSPSLNISQSNLQIFFSASLPRDLRLQLESNYQLALIEGELSFDPKAICIIDETFLSLHQVTFLESFQSPLIYVGEEVAALPANCFFLPWENRDEIFDLIRFFEKFSSEITGSFKNLKKEKDHFIRHLFSLCLSNQRLSHEDRRWLQDSVTACHTNLLIVGSLEELSESINKIASQLRPNISKLNFSSGEKFSNNKDFHFRYGIFYREKIFQLEASFSENDFAAAIFFYTLAKTTELV
jgi:hypothetical protein